MLRGMGHATMNLSISTYFLHSNQDEEMQEKQAFPASLCFPLFFFGRFAGHQSTNH